MIEKDLTKKTFSSVFINELGKEIIVNEYKDRVILLKGEVPLKVLNKILKNVKEFLLEEEFQSLNEVDGKTKSKKKR